MTDLQILCCLLFSGFVAISAVAGFRAGYGWQ